ncbi:MAG: MoaD/ThiS family protein [Bacteroidota bacterium]
MKLTLKFFGRLTEITGSDQLAWQTDETLSLTELEKQLDQQFPDWSAQTYRIAVNQHLVDTVTLNDGDEVAFLPPFAGG